MTELSDRLIKDLIKVGVKTYFGVQGGACARLIQSLTRNGGKFIPVLNEQAAGYSAHGYYLANNRIAGCIFTTGPGFTNGVSGIAACYFDGVPIVTLVGQVNNALNKAERFKTKMIGFQEVQHLKIAETIASSTYKINSKEKFYSARPNIINSIKNNESIVIEINDEVQRFAVPNKNIKIKKTKNQTNLNNNFFKKIFKEIKSSNKKGVLLIGAGARKIQFSKKILRNINKSKFPVGLTWGGQFLQKNFKNNLGLFGRHTNDIANEFIRDCDFIIATGCSLLQHQAGKNSTNFAPRANIFYINNNNNEIIRAKHYFGKRLISLKSDCSLFFEKFFRNKIINQNNRKIFFKNKKTKINSICKALKKILEIINDKNYIIFSDAGATLSWTYLASENLKICPPIYTSFNLHAMGYSNCAAVGAAIHKKKSVLAIIGDGSLPMNLQELAWLKKYNIKLIIVNNQGYGIIRQTQKSFYNSNFLASDFKNKSSCLPSYNINKVLKSFDIKTFEVSDTNINERLITNFLKFKRSSAIILNTKYENEVFESEIIK